MCLCPEFICVLARNLTDEEPEDRDGGDSDAETDALSVETLSLPGGGPGDEDCHEWWHPDVWAVEEMIYENSFRPVSLEIRIKRRRLA